MLLFSGAVSCHMMDGCSRLKPINLLTNAAMRQYTVYLLPTYRQVDGPKGGLCVCVCMRACERCGEVGSNHRRSHGGDLRLLSRLRDTKPNYKSRQNDVILFLLSRVPRHATFSH